MTIRRVVLERQRRLAHSVIWQLQRTFFEERGLTAWSEGIVPHYVTSNPRMAAGFAHVVLGFLNDCQPTERVHVVELGAGSGRFGHRFLSSLQALQPRASPPLTYVMTDLSEKTLAALQAHPRLHAWVDQGVLDFAHFDLEQPGPLHLRHAQRDVPPGGPLIVIANYVFDSVPQDCFAVRNGELRECLVTTTVPESVANPADPIALGHLRLTYTERAIDPEHYYPDPTQNGVLESYARTLPDTVILFPVAALNAMRYFSELDHAGLLVMTADKGFHQHQELASARPYPRLTLHGSFSLSVNYHALGEYVRARGAEAIEPRHQPTSLRICAYVWGEASATRAAYADAIELGGPDDFYALKQTLERHYTRLSLRQILSYVRISGFDSNVMLACASTIRARLPKASTAERADLAAALDQVWAAYLPIGEEQDLAFELGTLLFELGHVDRALAYFEASRQWWGADAATAYNTALCHKRRGDLVTAMRFLDEALQLDKGFEAAALVREELLAAGTIVAESG